MNKFSTFTMIVMLLFGFVANAQAQSNTKKPNFTLDEKTMTELGFTAEQKQKIQEIKTNYNLEAKKTQTEESELQASFERKMDSTLTAPQKQKVTEMKEAIKLENKQNPALRKIFSFDKKTMDELGFSAEQQQKIGALNGTYQTQKWKHAQKWNKLFKDTFAAQDAVLSASQKQKAEEMKASIAEYNKNIK